MSLTQLSAIVVDLNMAAVQPSRTLCVYSASRAYVKWVLYCGGLHFGEDI